MKLNSFSVKKLHGVIDLNFGFYDDMTVIVGRNGSGKTSALALITDILPVDIGAIAAVSFSELHLQLTDSELGIFEISGSNTEQVKILTYKLGNTEPIPLPLGVTRTSVSTQPSLWTTQIAEWLSSTSSPHLPTNMGLLGATFNEVIGPQSPLSRLLEERSRLTYVKLDRTIIAIGPTGSESLDGPQTRSGKNKGKPREPIEQVLDETRKKFARYKQRLDEIKASATAQLLRLLFLPIDAATRPHNSARQLKSQMTRLQDRVAESALLSDHGTLGQVIEKFFAETEALIQDSLGKKRKVGRPSLREESLELLLNLKQQQILQLLSIFEEERNSAATAFSEIDRYLDVVNRFLIESGKQLTFSPALDLSFIVNSETADNAEVNFRSIKELSSGERQVVIVLTFLAFLAGDDAIFVIDEPELSLHVRWQGYLINALKELRPSSCQIVVATHAPEIAGRARDRCVVLSPSYLPPAPVFDSPD